MCIIKLKLLINHNKIRLSYVECIKKINIFIFVLIYYYFFIEIIKNIFSLERIYF